MSVKVPQLWYGKYIGNMSEQQAQLIMGIRESNKIDYFKHSIFSFPPELVLRSLEEGRSIREIIKTEGIDFTKYPGELREYQTVGTAFMYASPRSMIADGVGLGKTVEVAALLNVLFAKGECRRFLMAVETGALGQTQAELIKYTGLNIITLPSEAVKMRRVMNNTDWRKVHGIIIKHTALRSDVFSKTLALNLDINTGKCRLFDTFILDESSCIKNNETKMYQYTYNICQLADRVHFMNATAFETKLLDIYYQLDMMNIGLLPEVSKIKRNFCEYGKEAFWRRQVGGKAERKYRWSLEGYKNQEVFKQSVQLSYFGRTKKDVGIATPHIHKVYFVQPTVKQGLALAKGYRYNEVLNCPSLIQGLNIPTNRKEVPKLDRLIETVENEFSSEKVMIYAFHREAQNEIKRELEAIGRKPLILNGETKQEDKYSIQNEFNHGDCDVIITNIKKSLNLYGGDACIFYSAITNPAAMFQAAGRIDRNVDDKIKTFILMLYEGTDEYNFFVDTVKSRAKDARDFTIDAKTAVDYFIESMEEGE